MSWGCSVLGPAQEGSAVALRIEARPEGSVLLTDTGGGRPGLAAAGLGVGGLVLVSLATGGLTLLGSVAALPFGVIAILAGLAAARHRDWILFDHPARQIVFRRGLASIFRPASVVPFDEVAAILVEEPGPGQGPVDVALRREGDVLWPIDVTEDREHAGRLVAALREVGRWPVQREREGVRR
jgi:hypothetical protein